MQATSKSSVLSIDERKELFLIGYKKLVDEYGIAVVAAQQLVDTQQPTQAPAQTVAQTADVKAVSEKKSKKDAK